MDVRVDAAGNVVLRNFYAQATPFLVAPNGRQTVGAAVDPINVVDSSALPTAQWNTVLAASSHREFGLTTVDQGNWAVRPAWDQFLVRDAPASLAPVVTTQPVHQTEAVVVSNDPIPAVVAATTTSTMPQTNTVNSAANAGTAVTSAANTTNSTAAALAPQLTQVNNAVTPPASLLSNLVPALPAWFSQSTMGISNQTLAMIGLAAAAYFYFEHSEQGGRGRRY